MLNIGGIEEGYVLDHIKPGQSLVIYHHLNLDKRDYAVAMIRNAKSEVMGRKDILKVECPIDEINLDILSFIDSNITVNIIKGQQLLEKKRMTLPDKLTNILRCKNPRCITSIEQELPHVFVLKDMENKVYRCKYCDEKHGELH